MTVCCNHGHGNAVQGFWAVRNNRLGVFNASDFPVVFAGDLLVIYKNVLRFRV